MIIAALIDLSCIQNHEREIYSFQKISVGNTTQIEGAKAPRAGRTTQAPAAQTPHAPRSKRRNGPPPKRSIAHSALDRLSPTPARDASEYSGRQFRQSAAQARATSRPPLWGPRPEDKHHSGRAYTQSLLREWAVRLSARRADSNGLAGLAARN